MLKRFHGNSPPQVKNLEGANEIICELWQMLKLALCEIEELKERLDTDSNNSSKPPSSDSPAQRAKRKKKPKSSRKKGAQVGHKKHSRPIEPESKVNQFQSFYPDSHCQCGQSLLMEQAPHCRHQVFDLPPVHYHLKEYQLYAGYCSHCDKRHHAVFPDWVPSGQMGPGLISSISLLSGQFHLSTRKIQSFLKEQWSLNFSIGAISESQGKINSWLEPLYRQIGQYVRSSSVANADETTYYRGKERRWLWTLVAGGATYFMTHYSRGKAAANTLLGDFCGVLVTDHYSGYNGYDREKRQLCWAHLIRGFERISQRRGKAGDIGNRLLFLSHLVSRTHHRYQSHQFDPPIYHRSMARLRQSFKHTLELGSQHHDGQKADGKKPRTASQCAHLLKDEEMCWTFLRYPCVPLTNNTAERSIRPYLIWRKLSFAVQSSRGEQFRPMILSIVETAKGLGISTSDLLREVCELGLRGEPVDIKLPLFPLISNFPAE